jgi:DNA-binding response OmpR family regulator
MRARFVSSGRGSVIGGCNRPQVVQSTVRSTNCPSLPFAPRGDPMAQPIDNRDSRPGILLIDYDPDLRSLEELVLDEDGYRVVTTDHVDHAADLAEQVCPEVVVVGIPGDDPHVIEVVDQLRARPTTEAIPVVVVSTSEQMAASAKASPNVRDSVIAPYDIDALEAAVESAMHHPPPPAVLPRKGRPVSTGVRRAGAEMTRQARPIVLNVLRDVRQVEPYHARFPELSLSLIDDLGTVLGAIAHGIEHGLAPTEVYVTPDIHRSIDAHVKLRKSQGLGVVSAIHEDQILERQIDRFVHDLIGTAGLTAEDALEVNQVVREYFAELVRIIVAEYTAERP